MTTEELKLIGVNTENLKHLFGDMNIIVQSIPPDEDDIKEGIYRIYPDIYQPRKNRVWSYAQRGDEYINLNNDNEKEEYIMHLKDSAERLKILSHLLLKQAEEIKEFGYPKTTVYFPE